MAMYPKLRVIAPSSVLLAAVLGGCAGQSPAPSALPRQLGGLSAASARATNGFFPTISILQRLDDQRTIGSTVDPINGDQNPYGLDIAKSSRGRIAAGDLVVCNFNDAANVQGTGTTIVALRPAPGSTPTHIAQNAALDGCDALALDPFDDSWNAAFAANDNPIVGANGVLITRLAQFHWNRPFGETFAVSRTRGLPVFYVSQAGDGSIIRVTPRRAGLATFERIATGFAVNGGAPGSILGPSGLQYAFVTDTLYVVDGANNTLTSLDHISQIGSDGVHVGQRGSTFTGPFAHEAKLLYKGTPLNGPISSALLPGGNIVLGNTLDPNGTNLLVEFSPSGKLLATKNVDTGASGAIFGMVASGHTLADTKLYFNDDNLNAVEVLQP